MRIAPYLAGAVVALSMSAAAPASATVALPNMSVAPSSQSQVDLVRWRGRYIGHCVRWRHICADRWGWGTWRFRRCLHLHGC